MWFASFPLHIHTHAFRTGSGPKSVRAAMKEQMTTQNGFAAFANARCVAPLCGKRRPSLLNAQLCPNVIQLKYTP
jgi:hypothetical protein